MKRMLVAAAIVLSTCLMVNAGNDFMDPDEPDYQNHTAKIIGTWNIVSLEREDDGEQIGWIYSSGTLELQKPEKAGRDGVFVVRLSLSDSLKKVRGDEWRKDEDERMEDETFAITKYDVVYTGEWEADDVDEIEFELLPIGVDIEGTGVDFDDFISGESGVLGTSQGMAAVGGAFSIIGGAIRSGSGVNDFAPPFPVEVESILEDGKLKLLDDASNTSDDLDFVLER